MYCHFFSTLANFWQLLRWNFLHDLQDRTQDLFMRMMSHPIAEEHLPSALMTFYTGKTFWHFLTTFGKGRQIFDITSDAIKIVPHFKNDPFGPFLVIYCRLHVYLSQKLCSDDHFEVLHV